jgi:hypothetical protein
MNHLSKVLNGCEESKDDDSGDFFHVQERSRHVLRVI